MAEKFPPFSISFTRPVTPGGMTVFFATLLVISMTFSPFLLSVSMWGLVGVAIWHTALRCKQQGILREKSPVKNSFRVLKTAFRTWWKNKTLRNFSLLFIVVAASGFWSDDIAFWLERTRVRIPFFILPWAFANLPTLNARQLRIPLYLLIFTVTLISIGVAFNLWQHFDAAMEGLRHGRPISVPRSHIRFSLIMVTAILAGVWCWREKFVLRYRWERPLLGGCIVFLFGFLHVLSVRSGMAALYAAVFVGIILYFFKTRNWRLFVAALALMLLTPWVAVKTIPSLQQRLAYMEHDWQQFKNNSGGNYSDSERWISFQAGWIIFKENPILGAGAGDLPAEIRRIVNLNYPSYTLTPKLPHNQFLYIMAGTGIVGLISSLIAFLYPLFIRKNREFVLLILFQVVVLVSFLVEYTIETSIGVAFYMFYMLWLMKMANER